MKKLITALLAAAVMLTAVSSVFAARLGDINGDGVYSGKDVNLMLQYLSGIYITDDTAVFDVYADGTVNGKDANFLVQIISGLYEVPDEPEKPAVGGISVSDSTLSIVSGCSAELYVCLDAQPDNTQTVSITADSEYCLVSAGNLYFAPGEYLTAQTVTVSAADDVDEDISTVIGFSSDGTDTVYVNIMVLAASQQKYEELTPYASGFITNPVHCYTAYYDVDYEIEQMYAEIDGNGEWFELRSDTASFYTDNYFTNNACTVLMPDRYSGQSPTVRLRAYYSQKVAKLDGEPLLELDGYRIKATLGDVTEYFTPWATKPFALIGTTEIPINDYIKFDRTTESGVYEEFYLVLRPRSSSRFTVNGLSPTNCEKIFTVSQDRNKVLYKRIYSYYTKTNGCASIKFADMTDPTIQNYDSWRKILKESVDTFNSCLGIAGINAHIEEVSRGESDNYIIYGTVSNDYAGVCDYFSSSNCFRITVSSDRTMLSNNAQIKSTTVHEMGHLLGFNDSAYAIDDSLYSYARDRERVTYFQPGDIATMLKWMAG